MNELEELLHDYDIVMNNLSCMYEDLQDQVAEANSMIKALEKYMFELKTARENLQDK